MRLCNIISTSLVMVDWSNSSIMFFMKWCLIFRSGKKRLSTCLLGRNPEVNRELPSTRTMIYRLTIPLWRQGRHSARWKRRGSSKTFSWRIWLSKIARSSSDHTAHLMLWTYQLWKRSNLKDKARLSMCITRINLMGDAKGHRCCHRQHQHQSESSVPHPNPRSRECCFCHLTILHAKWNILRNYW